MTDAPPPSVLYIDDDAGLRRLAARTLARQGFVVAVAEGGEQGMAMAQAARYDLIAVDHYMPGLDGLETLARLQAIPAAPPVVYVTGSDEGRIAVAALKAGAADYVVKSVGSDFFDLLASAFRQVLDRAALERGKAAAEDQLRASNARLEALLREVNHRVANSLQLVTAMVQMQAAALADPGARAALDDTQRRITAIAQVHQRLYTSSDVEQVDLREYLGALIDQLGATWSSAAAPRRLSLTADPIRLATDRAVSLGVIVTELVSNACKYAYPIDGGVGGGVGGGGVGGGPGAGGEVRVALAGDGDSHFVLSVEDDGVGMVDDAPARGTGVGTKLIRAMAQSLQTIVEYDTARPGVRATLRAAVN